MHNPFPLLDAAQRRFDTVVFDWDGTVMDSIVAIAQSIQLAATDLFLPKPSFEQASQVIGLGLAEALQKAIPQAQVDQLPKLSERYRHHYLAQDADLTVFPGMVDLLMSLRQAGFTLAVATGKSRVGLNRSLASPLLKGLFQATRCAEEGRSKPDPWMLDDLALELNVPVQRMLMIGDSVYDREMAKRAGAGFIGVAYGAHPAAELGQIDCLACAQTVEALVQALRLHLFAPGVAMGPGEGASAWTDVCAVDELWEGGLGQRFEIPAFAETGFVVRFEGQAHAYVNRCAHVSIEMDWQPGQFFDDQGQYLVCSTHGALYEPNTGLCVGGPCRGQSLVAVAVREHEGRVQVNLSSLL